MHIETVHIHVGSSAVTAAALAALLKFESSAPRDDTQAGKTNGTATAVTPPAIGQPSPGIDGIYAGVSRGENGEPDGHLVLLNAKPEGDMTWDKAVEWAQSLGDGARLPTRFESALLYANVQDQLDTERWHWTGTQYSSDRAWGQYFDHGNQYANYKKFEARARAVRRLIL